MSFALPVLSDVCVLVEPTVDYSTIDSSGSVTVTQARWGPVPCRVRHNPLASASGEATATTELTVTGAVFILEPHTAITDAWSIDYGGALYRVVKVTRPVNYAGVEDHVRVDTTKPGGFVA